MKPNTDRLIISDVKEIKKEKGMFSSSQEDVVEFRTAIVKFIGVKPDGSLPTNLKEGDKVLINGNVIPVKIPFGEDLYLIRRTNYETVLN